MVAGLARVIDVFTDELDLTGLAFEGVAPAQPLGSCFNHRR